MRRRVLNALVIYKPAAWEQLVRAAASIRADRSLLRHVPVTAVRELEWLADLFEEP